MYPVDNVDHAILNMARNNCPLHESHFIKYFIGDLNLVLKNIDPIDLVSAQYQSSAYNSLDVSVLVASHAMKILEDTSYRNWSETTDEKLGLWARTLWRFCLTVPIGYITESNFVGSSSNNESWNPAAVSLEMHLKGGRVYSRTSGRQLSPSYTSVAFFCRLFGDTFEYSGPMQGQSLVDAFDSTGGRENPIRQAFKRAALKSLHEINKELLPYWWLNCFQAFGVIEESEGQDLGSASIEINKKQEKPELNAQLEDEEPRLIIPNNKEINNEPSRQAEEPTHTSEFIKDVSQVLLSSGINCKGALLYKISDDYWVKYPKIEEDLAKELGVNKIEAHSLIKDHNVLEVKNGDVLVKRFSIEPNGKAIGKMRLAKVVGPLAGILNNRFDSEHNNQDLVQI